MRNILIIGESSYIGNSLKEWLMREPEKYQVDKVSSRNNFWQKKDFSQYDVVYHVAGVAHIKETRKNQELYYRVNSDLAYEVAKKAKSDGVKHFIFLSSMSVYGVETGVIKQNTLPHPKTAYGKSKLKAEKLINTLVDDLFLISIVRPPMIYGKGCKGNYPRLANLVLKIPMFPLFNNERSMIYIENFSEFVKQLIDYRCHGTFFPQNNKLVSTSEMVKLINEAHGQKIILTKKINPLLRRMNTRIVNKIFGSLSYEMSMSNHLKEYNVKNFEESIVITESK